MSVSASNSSGQCRMNRISALAKSTHTHLLVFTLIATFLAYSNSFRMDFIGDDIVRIVGLNKLAVSFESAMSSILPDRPLLTLSLWLNQQLGGLNPIGYKIVNLILHGLVG